MIVLYILALVFLALSILFFLGKGKNLISGYNTMSDKEKSKYDEKKLCRAVGVICLVCFVLICVLAFLGSLADKGILKENYMIFVALGFVVILLTTIIIASIYINKKAKK